MYLQAAHSAPNGTFIAAGWLGLRHTRPERHIRHTRVRLALAVARDSDPRWRFGYGAGRARLALGLRLADAHCHLRVRPRRGARSRGRRPNTAMIQAMGVERGLVSRARIRSRPSSDGSSQSTASCSARRKNSS
jgi:hypothetical protein